MLMNDGELCCLMENIGVSFCRCILVFDYVRWCLMVTVGVQ